MFLVSIAIAFLHQSSGSAVMQQASFPDIPRYFRSILSVPKNSFPPLGYREIRFAVYFSFVYQ